MQVMCGLGSLLYLASHPNTGHLLSSVRSVAAESKGIKARLRNEVFPNITSISSSDSAYAAYSS